MYESEKTLEQESAQFSSGTCMVVTQLGVWNVGKESVQAAEDSVIYSDDMENDADETGMLHGKP